MMHSLTRRDACYYIGKRGTLLNKHEAACAWRCLSGYVEELGERDLPKFKDLLKGIRAATIYGKAGKVKTK